MHSLLIHIHAYNLHMSMQVTFPHFSVACQVANNLLSNDNVAYLEYARRTLEGICSASSLEAAASEPEGMRCQNAANHRLHSVLVAASTGQCLAKVQPGSSPAHCFAMVSKSVKTPPRQWPHTGPHGAGAAVQQMWGAQWRGYAAEAAGGVSSLDALADADLSPVQALLESCILVPLLERVCLRLTLLHCLS